MKHVASLLFACAAIAIGNNAVAGAEMESNSVHLITLDPGHFHAALVQKFMYAGVDPLVHVYAPPGDDLQEHLKRIEAFNSRADQPTHWREQVYTGNDYFRVMLGAKAGNVVVLSGNNARKADYILASVRAGLNVLADKPMAITPADLDKLKTAFAVAASNHVLLYDIMTERYEVTTQLQRELSRQAVLFGALVNGSSDNPAITKESVHHFSKIVSGAPLKRPAWFFDVRQQGEGIVDVTTHLVDLVQWEAFPDQALSADDVHVLNARRSMTPITREQFKKVTGLDNFPGFLRDDVRDGVLQVCANGTFTYTLRGVHARVSVTWNFEAPPGSADTHYSIMRGTGATLAIRQGPEQQFKPVLYVENPGVDGRVLERNLNLAIAALQNRFPGVSVVRDGKAWRVVVPEKYNDGHEAHFARVTETFLAALRAGRLPDWEVPNMLTKYATIMRAYELSR